MNLDGPRASRHRSIYRSLCRRDRRDRRGQPTQSRERDLEGLDAGAKAFGLALEDADRAGAVSATDDGRSESDGPTAKHIIVHALEMAYPDGLKAAKLREIVETQLGRPVHYKTAGMTLYRLKDAEVVEREGMVWKLANPPPRWVPDEPDDTDDVELDWDFIQHEEDRMTGG